MALGFLKVAGSIVKGVSGFIKNRREKREEKIDRKVSKAVAKAEKQKAALAGLLGGEAAAAASTAADELSLPSLAFNASDIFKISAAENAGGNAQSKSAERGNTSVVPGQVEAATSNMPAWLLPVAIVLAVLFFIFKKRR